MEASTTIKALNYAKIQTVEKIILDKIITTSKLEEDFMTLLENNGIELNPEEVTDTLLNLGNGIRFNINWYSELINNNEDETDEYIGQDEREDLENTISLIVDELCSILDTDYTYLKYVNAESLV